MMLTFLRCGQRFVSRGQTSTAILPLLLAITFVSAAPTLSLAAPPAHSAPVARVQVQESYIQELRGVGGNPDALQTAIRRFDPVKGQGPSIYLVAAVHIGEKSYYEQLQRFLDKQDVVLYEGVRRSRTATTVKAAHSHAASVAKPSVGIQKKMADALNLQFQLEGIHYDRPQFYNSDMDWDSLTALAKKAGAGTEKKLADLEKSVSGSPNIGLSGWLLNYMLTQAASRPVLSNILRHAFITALSDPKITEKSSTPDSVKLASIIVVERNKVVIADLQALLKTSKSKRRSLKQMHSIAVFYGAEHMKNMGQHLISDLGYRATNTRWVTVATN